MKCVLSSMIFTYVRHIRNASVLELLILNLLAIAFDNVTAGDNVQWSLGRSSFA